MFKIKPRLIYLCYIMFAISLSSAFLVGNLTSLFKFLGAADQSLPFFWLIPPLTGIIIQPLIGQLSDDTTTRFGKRKPYIIGFGLLASVAFGLLTQINSFWLFTFMILIVDCSINATTEATRAFAGDYVKTNQERYRVFALQAIFAGIGGSIGMSLPMLIEKLLLYLNVEDQITKGAIPSNLNYALLVVAIVMLSIMVVSAFRMKERPFKTSLLSKKQKSKTLYTRVRKSVGDLSYSFVRMPSAYRKILLTHSLTWIGIFAFWLYFTISLAQTKFGLPVGANIQTNMLYAELFHQATLSASFYFAVYQYVSIAYVLLLFFLSYSDHLKLVHALSLFVGGLGLIFLSFMQSDLGLFLAFVGIGILWGSLIVLPYTIVLQTLPKGKMGVYLGIFNISITAPQILCGMLLSPVYTYLFKSHAHEIMLFAGIVILLSAFLWLRLYREELQKFSKKLDESKETSYQYR